MAKCGTAIFQDQAGQYDWLKQHVGRVSAAVLTGGPQPAIYAASADAGTLAALAPADGHLLWRRVLAAGDAVTRLVATSRQVITLSAGGSQLMAWDALTGAAAWAADLAVAAADLAVLGRDAVAVSVGSSVKAFALDDGKQLWSVALGGGGAKLFASADGLWAAAADGSGVAAALLSQHGSVQRQLSLSGSSQLSGSQLEVGDAAVAALSADGSSLCAAALQEGTSGLSCQRLASLLPAGTDVSAAQLLPGSCAAHAVLQTAGGAALLSLGGGGGTAVVTFVAGATASGCFAGADPAGSPLVALATPSAAGLAVQVLSGADGSAVQPTATIAALAPRRADDAVVPVAALFGGAARAGRVGQQEFFQLAVFDDDSLALVADGQQAWLRHEELASIQDVLFTDLPAPTPENEAAWAASQPGWRETLAAQVLQLKVQASQLANVQLATPEEQQRLEAYKALTSDKLRPSRDADGFRKQVVALTQSGKVLALHNGDGRLLWSLDLGRGAGLRKLVLWRVPHDVQHDIQVAAVATGSSGSRVIVINAHTGAVEQTLAAEGEAAQLLHLPQPLHDGFADQHAYVLVPAGASGAAKVLPDTAEARAAFQAARPALSFWRLDEAAGSIQGLGFSESGEVEERWSAVLAPAGTGQRILAVAAHSPGEAVASPARVLGDGSLKFKYLNPNTLLVVVGLPAGAAPAADAAAPAKLTAVVLDAVTGRVLFSQAHEGATGPVHAVLSENMAAYHFWSVDAHRWQVAAIELYDASPTTMRVSDVAFSVPNVTASSWDTPPVEAAATTLLSRLAADGLAVTRSARGNTAKQVIMLTPAGRVYLLDRRFLDPRRPVIPAGSKPTAIQAAEGLPPFAPELPLSGQQYATLDHQVARLRGVAVEPAVLESTQLMVAHGLDLFYNRLTPSKSFDRLPDDFPFALLTLIVVGMAGGTLVLSQLQTRALVKKKWE
ncbi:ER membrane complex subunit 1 [Chlorella sorokiniana]|uniref:ER membrane protein complex subunit 1 n=1 Tax=Chlorella sorokiniana TaxID=3076 RepID=A0A2P6U0A8_CHLSO|nr:ER membrane complex subunit 1 [Chlorella sorokiniana]|eukprot:PRW59755.1 ER membrane complex subunit 1 [Chlorella sorokiniana]